MNNFLNQLIILCALALFVTSVSAYAGESGEDTSIAQQIRVSVIEPTLFAHKICFDTNDCNHRAVMRYSVAGQISWRVYILSDRDAIAEMFTKMLAIIKTLPSRKNYAIYIYSEKEQDVGFFVKPIAQLLIQGEK